MACRVGLTGGLASGKSTVAKMLAERGIPVMDADEVVHRLYVAGGEGCAVVRRLFGDSLLGEDGSVDREALGRAVLARPQERRLLEQAIHPLVRAEVDAWAARQTDAEILIFEAALLVETGSWRLYDALVVVWCDPAQQLARAQQRGMSRSRAEAIIDVQATLDERLRAADVAIDNSGCRSELDQRVDWALKNLKRVCSGR